jgi:hypothetical protein
MNLLQMSRMSFFTARIARRQSTDGTFEGRHRGAVPFEVVRELARYETERGNLTLR